MNIQNTLEKEEEIMLIYEWVDNIPLSRNKKLINRDFSDGVLMAEIIKFFYPNKINLNTYPEVNSTKKKIENWNTLNDKVLKKLGFPLENNTIEELASSKPGVIEEVLKRLYIKINVDGNNSNKNHFKSKNIKNDENKKKKIEKINYKDIIFKKELEITNLQEKLKNIGKEIKQKTEENENLKEEIENTKKKVNLMEQNKIN